MENEKLKFTKSSVVELNRKEMHILRGGNGIGVTSKYSPYPASIEKITHTPYQN